MGNTVAKKKVGSESSRPWFMSTYMPSREMGIQMTYSADFEVYTTDTSKLVKLGFPCSPSGDPSFNINIETVKNIVEANYNCAIPVFTLVERLLPNPNTNLEDNDMLYTDADKVRILFYWLGSIDVHSQNFGVTYNPYFMEHQLNLLKRNKTSYATIFAILCAYAMIPCVVIKGFAKGGLYTPGEIITDKYIREWNAVYVDGHWRLVDVLWGSQNDRWSLNPWFLFPCPEEFLYSHIPEHPNSIWQLVSEPISKEMFGKQAYLKKRCFEMNVSPISHPYGEIHCKGSDKGESELLFRLHETYAEFQSFRCVLKSLNENRWELVRLYDDDLQVDFICQEDHNSNAQSGPIVGDENMDEFKLQRATTFANVPTTLSLKVRFPKNGVYKLEIVGKMDMDEDDGGTCEAEYDWIAIYRVYAEDVPDWIVAFPRLTDIGFGDNKYLRRCGLDALTHTKGQIKCYTGTDVVVQLCVRHDAATRDIVLRYQITKLQTHKANEEASDTEEATEVFATRQRRQLIFDFSVRFKVECEYLITVSATLNGTDKGEVIKYMVFCKRDPKEVLEEKIQISVKALQSALLLQRTDALKRALILTRVSGVEKEPKVDVLYSKAERMTKNLRILRSIPQINSKTVALLRSLKSPDSQVLMVVKAVLLLLGEPPRQVQSWNEMARKLTVVGRNSLLLRIKQFNVKNVPPARMNALREILGANFDLPGIVHKNQETAALAKWLSGVISAYQALQTMNGK